MSESQGSIMVDKADFDRLEDKVDKLAEALSQLVRIDERQSNQSKQLIDLTTLVVANYTELKTKYDDLDKKVNKCINMGSGAFGLLMFAVTMYETFISPNLVHIH